MATNVDPPKYTEVAESSQIFPPDAGPVLRQPAQKRVVVAQNAPDYTYEPSDYLVLSSLLSVLCCIFSPVVLLITLPALGLSMTSREAKKQGKMIRARTQGLVAAYLNVCAVFFAFLIGIVATILVITLSPAKYWNDNGR